MHKSKLSLVNQPTSKALAHAAIVVIA